MLSAVASIFTTPMLTSSSLAMWLVIPLCISVATIYRTLRTDDVRKLPKQITILSVKIIGAFAALCAIMLLIQHLFTG